MVVEGLLVGLAFAFALAGADGRGANRRGRWWTSSSGFSYGSLIDPINGNQGGVFSRLLLARRHR